MCYRVVFADAMISNPNIKVTTLYQDNAQGPQEQWKDALFSSDYVGDAVVNAGRTTSAYNLTLHAHLRINLMHALEGYTLTNGHLIVGVFIVRRSHWSLRWLQRLHNDYFTRKQTGELLKPIKSWATQFSLLTPELT